MSGGLMAARMLPPQAEGARSKASVPTGPNSAPSRAVAHAPPDRSSTMKSTRRAFALSFVSGPRGNNADRLSPLGSEFVRLTKIQKRTRTLCGDGVPRTRMPR
jgi:hypothetical protein